LLAEVGFSLIVDVAISQEDAELAVEAAFDVLAILDEGTRLCSEFEFLMFGKDMLFETLNRRYPGRLADEGRDFLDVGLYGRQNLNTGGAV
jgi:hypothetical protein